MWLPRRDPPCPAGEAESVRGEVTPIVRRLRDVLFDAIEIYIPVASFVVMFITFIIEIFYRYVLNNPLTWPFEITTITFVWTVLFGAIYTMRRREHIAFSLIYDLMSATWQRRVRLLSNGITFVGFGIAIVPSYRYVSFMHIQKTPVFQVPFSTIYAPFLVFLLAVMFYTLQDILKDLRGTNDAGNKNTDITEGGSLN